MTDLLIALPHGYDPNSQAVVGMVAASFDDQSQRLRETVAGLEIEHLEWQERPGRNTIGMLMAHLASAEVGMFCLVVPGVPATESKRVNHEHLGVDVDGFMPLDGTQHPASLKGRDLTGYFDLLARARSATHEVLKTWDDAALDSTISVGEMTLSHRFVLYRILDHFARHFGQIASVLHCMRDHEVPGLPEKRYVP